MPDYKKMYFKLYRTHVKVLKLLEEVTLETEEMAISAEEAIRLMDSRKDLDDREK